MRFTPGPWTVLPDGWRVAKLDEQGWFAQMICFTGSNIQTRTPENAANAMLIAQAPTMYSALQRIYEKEGWVWVGEVLAKAEGRQ